MAVGDRDGREDGPLLAVDGFDLDVGVGHSSHLICSRLCSLNLHLKHDNHRGQCGQGIVIEIDQRVFDFASNCGGN